LKPSLIAECARKGGAVTINARVQMAPEALEKIVRDIIVETSK